jgi:hypothetical protein
LKKKEIQVIPTLKIVQLRLLASRPFQSVPTNPKPGFAVPALQRLSKLNSRLRLGPQDVGHAGVVTGRDVLSLRTLIG